MKDMLAATSRSRRPKVTQHNRRVLIVDDSSTIRALVASLFENRKGPLVVGVADGAESAFQAIETLHPDVLTLDLSMPGLDVFTFLERLMREKPLPVVVLSSSIGPDGSIRDRALALGAAACFDKTTLIATADQFVRAIEGARVPDAKRAVPN